MPHSSESQIEGTDTRQASFPKLFTKIHLSRAVCSRHGMDMLMTPRPLHHVISEEG